MITVFEEDGAKMIFHEDLKLLELIWLRRVTSEEYRFIYNLVIEKLNEINTPDIVADNYLSDIRLCGVVAPEDRKWFQEDIVPKAYAGGIKKGAVVFSGNIFSKYYLNNISGATKKAGLIFKFVTKREDAIDFIQNE